MTSLYDILDLNILGFYFTNVKFLKRHHQVVFKFVFIYLFINESNIKMKK